MNIFARVLLDIITLGIFEVYLHSKAKKLSQQVNTELMYSKKYKFNINKFVNDLGGIDNIDSAIATLSSLKLELKDTNLVYPDLKSKYKINGLTKSTKSIILVFGDNSKAICDDINKLIPKTKYINK